jgi:hypothetical protein
MELDLKPSNAAMLDDDCVTRNGQLGPYIEINLKLEKK